MSKARDIADLDFNSPDIDGGNIDGAVIGGTTPAAGSFTALTIDTMTLNASSITGTSNLTLDIAGDINLDAGGADVTFKNSGTEFGRVFGSSDNFYIQARQSDKDMIFQGIDGSSTINALTLDMSNAGAAIFSGSVTTGSSLVSTNAIVDSVIAKTSGGNVTVKTNAGGSIARFNNNLSTDFFGSVTIPDYVIHDGNTATKFGFGSANTMNFISNGSDRLTIANSYAVFNEAGTDYDFRVESNGHTHMLFVDGGLNRIGINKSTPAADVHLKQTGDIGTGDIVGMMFESGVGSQQWIVQAGLTGISNSYFNIRDVTAGVNVLSFVNSSGAATFSNNVTVGADLTIPEYIYHTSDSNTYFGFPGGDEFELVTAGQSRMKLVGSGTTFNEGGADKDFRVESDSNAHMLFVDGGTNSVGIGTSSPDSSYSLNVSGAGNERIVIDSTNNTTSGIYMRVFNSGVLQGNSTLRVNNVGTLQAYMGNATSSETKYLDYIVADGVGHGTARFKGNIGINHGTSDISDYVIATGADNSYRSGVAFQLQSSQSQWQVGYVKIKTGAGRTGLQSHAAAEYLYRFQVHNEGISGIGLASSSGDTGSFTVSVTSQNPNTSTGTVELKIRTTASTAYGTHVIVGECHFYGGINKARREI